jgi:tetratricopeptide (TPR) repeat protein
LAKVGVGLSLALVVAAPLIAGGVHRPTMITLFVGSLLCMVAFAVGSHSGHRSMRIGATVVVPCLFLALALLQSVPMPIGVRALIDARGTALLAEHAFEAPGMWPLSLDPPATRAHVGKAAAALVAFMIAYHLASGQSKRHLAPRVVALTGVAAVAIGLVHRIFGATKLFGVFSASERSLLTGPFVNPNHTAALLELATFACLACSFHRRTALNRMGWMVGMLLCAGGTAATLSRGGVLALATGIVMFVFWRYRASEQEGGRRARTSLAWGALLTGIVVLAGAALGSSQLIDRFRASTVSGDTRFQLWRDSLHVVGAHPVGIGRGAFDRVYPVYRTLRTELTTRFAFVENQPLQMLIDGGWLFLGLVAAGFGFVAWRLIRHGRRDRVEAALVAGLFAVLVHSCLDFALETPGVLLPFSFILGTVLGRSHVAEERSRLSRFKWTVVATACLGLVVGMGSLAHGSADDFDALLKVARPEAKKQLVERAQRAHPIDYFYALVHARLEPLKAPSGTASPRFRALNRALALCPSCEAAHAEVARNLWSLGRRKQALFEWRSAIDIQPKLLRRTIGELFAAGARAEELAAVAASTPDRMLEVASFLSSVSRLDDAITVLDQAEAAGASRHELVIVRAELQLKSGQIAETTSSLAQARAAAIRDPRLEVVDAELRLRAGAGHGPDDALALLDAAAAQYPADLGIQRRRLALVISHEKWQASDRAVQGLKHALYQNQLAVGEVHTAAARIAVRLGRWTDALGQYRLALTQEPWNVAVWLEYGQAAESAGRDAVAREAYAEAARLRPNDARVVKSLHDVDERMARLRSALSRTPGVP